MSDEPHGPFFRRYNPENRAEISRQIERDRLDLAEAIAANDRPAEMTARGWLGFRLYITGQEVEAAPMLDAALGLSRQLEDRALEIELLLHLATAHQYCGARDHAQALFQAALERTAAYGITEQLHFILHHQGRCAAEQGDIALARHCFERALPLRRQLDEPRFVQSTELALVELDRWADRINTKSHAPNA